ncbi:MAG: NUDIX domain-containing protein [Patescibacteria group bacterium]
MGRNIRERLKRLELEGHSVLVIISKLDEKGSPLVLVLEEQRPSESAVLKLPGGKQDKDKGDFRYEHTVLRECHYKTGLVLNEDLLLRLDGLDYLGRKKRDEVPNQTKEKPLPHRQYIFFIDSFEGELRTEIVLDDPENTDIPDEKKDTLYPPFWAEVPDALKWLFPPHRKILQKCLPKIAGRHPAFARFVPSRRPVFPPSPAGKKESMFGKFFHGLIFPARAVHQHQ